MRKKGPKPTPRKDTSAKKTKAVKKKTTALPRKSRVPKTRNNGTMTESAFWSYIRSCLRSRSRFWKPIMETKKAAKRAYEGGINKRQRFEYQCGECLDYFPDKEVEVHHIEPAGSLSCADDLPGFVERLFCEKEGLIVLCRHCHDQEHKKIAA